MRIHNKGTLETRPVTRSVATDGTRLKCIFSGAGDERNPNPITMQVAEKCGLSHPVAAISISDAALDSAPGDGLSTYRCTIGSRGRAASEREIVERNRSASVHGRRAVAVVVSP